MKNALLLILLLATFSVSAQKKAVLKPTKLVAKSKNHTVSMEYKNDILYFTHQDLIDLVEKNTSASYTQALRYLRGTGNDEINFRETDTAKFKNAGERNLYKVVLQLAPQLLSVGKASDMVKKTHTFNLQLIVKPCETDETKKLVTDKKGRIIFGCE